MNLEQVQGGMALDAPTAAAWRRLVAAVEDAHGVTLTITSPGGAWRSEALVVDMYLHPAKYGASKGTARPKSYGGGGSIHENGRCIDIWNHASVPRAALVSLAARWGFKFTISGEPWHIQHDGVTTGGGGTAHHDSQEEDEVKTSQMHYTDGAGVVQRIAFTPGTAWYLKWNEGGSEIANGLAVSLGTANSVPATPSMFEAVVASAERLRQK